MTFDLVREFQQTSKWNKLISIDEYNFHIKTPNLTLEGFLYSEKKYDKKNFIFQNPRKSFFGFNDCMDRKSAKLRALSDRKCLQFELKESS